MKNVPIKTQATRSIAERKRLDRFRWTTSRSRSKRPCFMRGVSGAIHSLTLDNKQGQTRLADLDADVLAIVIRRCREHLDVQRFPLLITQMLVSVDVEELNGARTSQGLPPHAHPRRHHIEEVALHQSRNVHACDGGSDQSAACSAETR